jgi:hypothetical protein
MATSRLPTISRQLSKSGRFRDSPEAAGVAGGSSCNGRGSCLDNPTRTALPCAAIDPQSLLSYRIPRVSSARPSSARVSQLCLLLVGFGVAGCASSSSSDQKLEKALKQTSAVREDVFPLAGTVTIDSLAPSPDLTVVVMLNDPSKPDEPLAKRPSAECDSEGKFSFTTYTRDDGVPGPKKYHVTFAQLRRSHEVLLGPDQLGNRYNDPEKNAKNPVFLIEHKSPGNKDCSFNLKVEGEPPGTPGPHSLTHVD